MTRDGHPVLVHPQPTSPRTLGKSRGIEGSRSGLPEDSGYGSQTQSPDGKSTSSTRDSCLNSTPHVDNAGTTSRGQPVPPTVFPVAGLAIFDQDVGEEVYSHFQDVHRQIEGPLLVYIQSKLPGRKYRPVSVRLMVLGRSEVDAKPSIVVLCPEHQAKRVRKFFDKKSVRSLCQPSNSDRPSFEVFVVGRPPETKDGDDDVDVFIPSFIGESPRPSWTLDTYCGAPIIISQPSGIEKRCTLGGIIKGIWPNGDVKLYGLTIGHVFSDDLEAGGGDEDGSFGTPSGTTSPSSDWDLELSDTESEASEDEINDSEEIENKNGSSNDDDGKETESSPREKKLPSEEDALDSSSTLLVDAFAAWASSERDKLGSVSSISRRLHSATADGKAARQGAYYDWSLINMLAHKPNLIRTRKLGDGESGSLHADIVKPGELKKPESLPARHRKRQAVVVMSGSEGLKRGWLSPLPSRLLLFPGQEFIDTLVLNLDNNQKIVDGDSGSWVVNEKTLEVYGYVVASDAFGGGYVVPLEDAFRDIREKLQAQTVALASTIDMAAAKLRNMTLLDPSAPPFVPSQPQPQVQATRAQTSVLVGPDFMRGPGHAEGPNHHGHFNVPWYLGSENLRHQLIPAYDIGERVLVLFDPLFQQIISSVVRYAVIYLLYSYIKTLFTAKFSSLPA